MTAVAVVMTTVGTISSRVAAVAWADGPKSEDVVRDLDDILATLPSQEDADDDKRRDETEDNEYRHSRGRNDRRGRRMRGRDRDYDERDERRGRGRSQ